MVALLQSSHRIPKAVYLSSLRDPPWPSSVQLKAFPCHHSGYILMSWFLCSTLFWIALTCELQDSSISFPSFLPRLAHPLFIYFFTFCPSFSEPIGSSMPKVLHHDLKRVSMPFQSSLSMLCEGQAHPTPAFRSFYFLVC